jgi:hypothetical protein
LSWFEPGFAHHQSQTAKALGLKFRRSCARSRAAREAVKPT